MRNETLLCGRAACHRMATRFNRSVLIKRSPRCTPRLAVGNLPWNVDENALRDAFKHIGPITEAKVSRHADSALLHRKQ